MKILVDTNILLDVAQQRAPHLADSDRVLKWCEAHPGNGFIAWHSISNVYYILEKQLGDASARQFITIMLEDLEVAETGTASAKPRAGASHGGFRRRHAVRGSGQRRGGFHRHPRHHGLCRFSGSGHPAG